MKSGSEGQCLGKFKYQTFDLANMVAKRNKDSTYQPYHCPHCGSYHIGNSPKKLKGDRNVRIQEDDPDGQVAFFATKKKRR